MKKTWASAFLVFEVIFSFVMTNIFIVFGSVLSLFFLFPVLLVSALNYIRRLYVYKEYSSIIYTFVSFIKGRIWISFKVLFLPMFFLGIIVANFVLLNDILALYLPDVLVVVVLIIQIIVFYQCLGILLYSALILSIDHTQSPVDYYRDAFILLNGNIVRSFLGIMSLFAILFITIWYIDFAYLYTITIALTGFYIVVSNLFEKNVKKIKN